MDNGVAGPLHVDAPYSKGTIVQLDLEKMTATHLHSYIAEAKVRAASQGNLQVIDDDQILVGWGATAAYSEFTKDGTLLCEVHFAASSLFWWERWKTYRVYRHFGWVGEPTYPPTAKIYGNKVYVSWNGATEVKYWQLQGTKSASPEENDFEDVEMIQKVYFEDWFTIQPLYDFLHYRVVALDADHQIISHSPIASTATSGTSTAGIVIGICIALGFVLGVWFVVRSSARRKREGRKAFAWAFPAELFGRKNYSYSKL
jgi:hypothetical protein